MPHFEQPDGEIARRDRFTSTEVGLTHEFTHAFVRLGDSGDIEISAGEGLGIVMHPQNKSITFVADNIKFLTRDEEGLRWNKLAFNSQATKFNEPAFLHLESDDSMNPYRDLDEFLEDEDTPVTRSIVEDGEIVTIPRSISTIRDPDTGDRFDGTETDFFRLYGRYPRWIGESDGSGVYG